MNITPPQTDKIEIFLEHLQADIRIASKLYDIYADDGFRDLYRNTTDLAAAVGVLCEAQQHVNISFLSLIESILEQQRRKKK